MARHRIETAGKASRLVLAGDNPGWKANGMDLQHVSVVAVDGKSRRVPDADMSLLFEVDGPAEIVGVINGDITSNEMMTGNRRSLYGGRASVILRSTAESGTVTLTVTPDKGKPVKYKMATK